MSLTITESDHDDYHPKLLSSKLLNTFLTEASNAQQLPAHLAPLHPLPLDAIGQNLDLLVPGLAKLYLLGFHGEQLQPNVTELATREINQTATLRFPVPALLSSKPFVVALTIVDGVLAVVLLALLWSVSRGQALCLFDLENLCEVLVQERGYLGDIDSGKYRRGYEIVGDGERSGSAR